MRLVKSDETNEDLIKKKWMDVFEEHKDSVDYFVVFVQGKDGLAFHTEESVSFHTLIGRLDQATHLANVMAMQEMNE